MSKIEALIRKGVSIPNPASLEIGDDVDVDRIEARGVTLHAGCKIYGARTWIAEGARLGFEGPVSLQDCCVGPDVTLNGGFFQEAVFLMGASCGSGAHVRGGTILEERASIAHTVGLKQTILFPYVTLGSLINFCDCLMAGGTGPGDHSEVGSSYIHFNFTPNQDKATPSLIGDVSGGVMLDQPPIFLGGQGGLVGPCRIAYGTILGAGTLCRGDQLTANRLVFEGSPKKGSIPFKKGVYRNVNRILVNNFHYLGNLFALNQWYRQTRARFVGPEMPEPLYQGLLRTLDAGIAERVRQLGRLAGKMAPGAGEGTLQQQFVRQWGAIEHGLGHLVRHEGRVQPRDAFLTGLEQVCAEGHAGYLDAIHHLGPESVAHGRNWLDSVVQAVLARMSDILPSLKMA